MLVTLRKSPTCRGEAKRAVPPVGITWLGTHGIVPEGFAHQVPDKDAAGVPYLGHPGPGLAHGQTQVFRRVLVGQVEGLLNVAHDDDAAVGRQALRDDLAAAQPGRLGLHLRRHRRGHRPRGRQEDGAGQGVVLGLGQQVGGNQGRVRASRRP